MNNSSSLILCSALLLLMGVMGCTPLGFTSGTARQGEPFSNNNEGTEDDLATDDEEVDDSGSPTDDGSEGPDDGSEGPDDDGNVGGGGNPNAPQDDAEIVSIDLPSALSCGSTYWASIEMRNIGQATWTRANGYKLGTVDDQDPLYGPDTRVWLDESDAVAPGQTHTFEFELAAPGSGAIYTTDWQMVHEAVTWFGETTSENIDVSCSAASWCDPLTNSSASNGFADKTVQGGSFSPAGWQATSGQDQLLLQLATPLGGSGSLSVDVTNFDPLSQFTGTKHQIINMYTSDDGSQGVFQTDEAWWNIRTGSNYGAGFKILAAPNGGNSREEARLIENATWDPNQTYTFTVSWDAQHLAVYLDGVQLESLGFGGRARALEYIFIGRDNVYDGQVGPIYSNLCVTQRP